MTNTRKLNTDKNSKIVIYVTSHGGEGFIKVRGKSVVLSEDLNRTLIEMHSKGRYKEIIFILDTCEAYTLYDQVNKAVNCYLSYSQYDQAGSLLYELAEYYRKTEKYDRASFLYKQSSDVLLREYFSSK